MAQINWEHYHANSACSMCIHTHSNRQKDKIHQIGHKLNLRKFTVTIAGPLLWNALPTYLCVLPNKKTFRNTYKNTYLKLWYSKLICQWYTHNSWCVFCYLNLWYFFLLIGCSQPKVLNFLGVSLCSYFSTFYCRPITQLLYCIVLSYDYLICFLRAIKFLWFDLICPSRFWITGCEVAPAQC